jgi:hypothetical protein
MKKVLGETTYTPFEEGIRQTIVDFMGCGIVLYRLKKLKSRYIQPYINSQRSDRDGKEVLYL